MKIRTACNRDCPDACGIIATVSEGRVTRLEGDPEHPITAGFLCLRTNRFLERQYDPERITRPMMRRNGELEPVEWERALDHVAESLLRIRAESGPAAILNYRSGGSLGLMKHLTDWFFECFGPVTIKSGDICSGAGEAAQLADFGDTDSHDLDDLLHSRTIVMWGKNPYVSNVHLVPLLRRAAQAGARLIQIDPVHHRGAELASLYLQPRPGGDIALALGVARRLFETGGVDPAAADYCNNLDEFRELCMSRDVEDWAALADVSVEQIEELTAAYADGPSVILVGWGMQRRAHGSAAVRVLDALGAISGNLGIPGGGVSFYFKRRGAFDTSFIRGLEAAPRSIPEPLLGPGILAATDPPIRMVWVSNGNPVAMLPDSRCVAQALRSREMTVVVDAFLTDTARCADVFLPTTTMLEDEDLVGAYGNHYLGNVQPVVDPPPGVLTDYGIVRELAGRVGLEDRFAPSAREWKRRLLSRVAESGATLEALKGGTVRNPEAPRVLFEGRRFATASGKVELIDEVDATPDSPDEERPLLLMALSTARAQASQSTSAAQRGVGDATVHPDAAPGMCEGQQVRIESARGAMPVQLRFDSLQRRDVVLLAKGGWMSRDRCANVLIDARATDAGGGACYYDTPVRLLPGEPTER